MTASASLVIFDLDGTLISSYMDNPDREYDRWEVLPGRREKLAELVRAGQRVAIATNQGGVAFGHIAEEEAVARVGRVLESLDLPADTPVEICFGHPKSPERSYREPEQVECRKPSGTMLRRLVERTPGARLESSMYVGDRPEDKEAAGDAGVGFAWAEEFFS